MLYNHRSSVKQKILLQRPPSVSHKTSRWQKSVLAVAMLSSLGLPATGWAKPLKIPNITVLGVDTGNGGVGPSFVVPQDFTPSDTLSIQVSGTVDVYYTSPTSGHIVNAAGVVVGTSPLTPYNVRPGQTYYTTTSHLTGLQALGALLIGNSSVGFFPLFRPTEQNGLGNSSPPTSLSLTDVPLSTVFPTLMSLKKGTVLEFRVNEAPGNQANNMGNFMVGPPVCEGRAQYDLITGTLNVPWVDLIENKQITMTVSADLVLLAGTTNLFDLQTVAEVTPKGNGTLECHAIFDFNSLELTIPFVDIPSNPAAGYPAVTYTATLNYKTIIFPPVTYDFVMTESRQVGP